MSESEQQGAKYGPQNATRSTKDVLKTTSLSNTLKSFPPSVEHLWWLGSVPWWSGTEGFKGFCGSLCKERCTGWNSSASSGPGADRRSG